MLNTKVSGVCIFHLQSLYILTVCVCVLLLSSRVQQLPRQPWPCPQESPRTNSSSPVRVTHTLICASRCEGMLGFPSAGAQFSSVSRPPGQILQVVRAPNGAQYIIQQPQQQILLQQQMQPGGVQAPVIQQVSHITHTPGWALCVRCSVLMWLL